MKTDRVKIFVMVFVSIAFLAIPSISFADRTAEEEATNEEVKQEIKETFESLKKYTAEQRVEAVKKVKITLDKIDQQIDRMEQHVGKKWDQMDQATRRQAASALATLRKKRNELAEWHGGLKYSSVEAWGHVRNGFLKSYEALSTAFRKAESEFKSNGSTKGSD